ncbi:unnamed protein product [Polarella glacialis]|uniref:2-oxopent-4-enoate hydratase n=1 Tax=Polarella glacialis TaxID=89957 RepID=A0A813JCS9_POLGL|nr:unnamed protein product [Polarella glacialis]
MICGPWGQILASTGQAEGDCLAVADLAPQQLGECRSRIPLRSVRSATPALSVASLAEVLTTSKQRTDKLAEELCRARQKGGRYLEGNLPKLTSPREAYAVQAATVKLAPGMGLGEVVGWKCGPCGQADYLKFGLSGPGAAPVFASGRSESPATLDFSPGSPASLTKLEAEFGFLMKHDLPPLKAAGGSETYSEEQVWAAVDCVVLCMEVCGSRYKPDVQAKLTGYQKMADCTNNLGVVLGPRVSKADLERTLGSPGAAALSSVEVSLSMNGLALDRGKGSVGVVEGPDGGSPLNSLVWLANHLQSEGLGLKGGEVVVCGAACKVGAKDFNFDAGGKAEFVADFKGLGQVLATVRRSNASDAARPDRSRSPRR